MKSKRTSREVQWVSRTLLYSPVYIGICTTEAQYRHTCKRYGINGDNWILPGAEATMNTFVTAKGATTCVVCIRPRGKLTRAAYAALIVHEAVHIWQCIRREIAERDPSAEFEAYSVQNLCQDLFEAVGL